MTPQTRRGKFRFLFPWMVILLTFLLFQFALIVDFSRLTARMDSIPGMTHDAVIEAKSWISQGEIALLEFSAVLECFLLLSSVVLAFSGYMKARNEPGQQAH